MKLLVFALHSLSGGRPCRRRFTFAHRSETFFSSMYLVLISFATLGAALSHHQGVQARSCDGLSGEPSRGRRGLGCQLRVRSWAFGVAIGDLGVGGSAAASEPVDELVDGCFDRLCGVRVGGVVRFRALPGAGDPWARRRSDRTGHLVGRPEKSELG